ncbi:MAG: UDP-N-acetylenolpyruvoylglucosamine reductase [Gallionellales bacterium GWA2_59_43]|nr:MAG: UDP-N-acetylenolpyruvoylglucosamine reductase [Gallionellales bacterium GWA2_59_43]
MCANPKLPASALSTQYSGLGLRGELRFDVPMRKHTSWRAGGVARRMYRPADLDDLLAFLRTLSESEPLVAVGLGSNLLVRDGGLRGTVLLMHGALTELRLDADGSIYVEAGVAGAKLARFASLHDLRGAEFCAGIPGTVGGMLAMNAGCYGSEIWEKILQVQTVNRRGELHVRTPQDYEIAYRHVALRDSAEEWFVSATLKFEAGDGNVARQEIKELLSKRIASQPLNLPNAGSVFRNPPGDFAARLIQQCGLKGKRIGGAQVSEKHANFIVNVGDATAADIENLINEVRQTVAAQTGVQLHPEVKIIGEKQ